MMLSVGRLLVLSVLATMLPLGCSVREGGSAGADAFAGLVDIGGREVYLECRGAGEPTVVLIDGFRNNAMVWSDDPLDTGETMVLPAVAEETRVCAWDRPGTIGFSADPSARGRSDPVPMPRMPEDVVAELHALLEAADEPGPYVLAAHSFGGVFARVYADAYPEDVVGMVLIDVWPEQLATFLSPEEFARFDELTVAVPPGLEDYTDLELVEPGVVSNQLLASPPQLQPMPLFVLARGQPLGLEPEPEFADFPGDVERAWRSGQDAMALLTPDARYEIAVESSHYVYIQQPRLVIEAIERVVQAVRDHDSW